MSKVLNIVFAGTPDFAASALQACIVSKHNVVAVFTQPDRPAGRGRKIQFGPVKQLAIDAGIPVFQPEALSQEQFVQIEAMQADVMLVSAYGLLLPKEVLDAPKFGCINIHASLLPRWRGAAPIQRAIIAGDRETGISIMQMVKGLDAGAVLKKFACEILTTDTSSSLHDRLATIAAAEIVGVLEDLQENNLVATPQNETEVTYAKKLSKQEANIDWQQNALEIERKIRAFNTWPIAYTYWKQQRIRIWEAEISSVNSDLQLDCLPGTVLNTNKQSIDVVTGDGILSLISLQLAGGKVISVQDFTNAHDISSQNFTVEPENDEIRKAV